MEISEFEEVRSRFTQSDTEGKINIYVHTTGLSQDQYRELLRSFPINELHRLEAAL